MELKKNLKLNALVKEKMGKLEVFHKELVRQQEFIIDQIEFQSNDAVRILLMELETGGNTRFEDEQKTSSWIGHCEKQIKKFIKRAASKESPKTIQIHRISRLHNRVLKLKFDERAERLGGADKATGYLCYTTNQHKDDEIFRIVEDGFGDNALLMTNYFDCKEANVGDGKHFLRKVVLARTTPIQTQEVAESLSQQEFAGITSASFPGADVISQKVALNDLSNVLPADSPRKFLIFNQECVLPEFLVEYSLDSDIDVSTSQIQRLLLDIAFSNRISQSNMPMVVHELTQKLKKVELVC